MPNHLLAAAASGSGKLPPNLLPAVVPLLALILALDAYCLIDLARARSVRHMPKWVWVLVILFISAPIGALVYLFVGRDRGQDSGRDPAQARTGAASVGGDAGTDQGPAAPVHPGTGTGTGAGVDQETDRAAGRHPGDQAPADCRPIVTTSGLTRDYGGAGLFDVDLVVPRGSIYGLVGPNGAGKTTLLSLLSATRRPDRGTISMHIGRSQIAVCPDVPEFDGWLTAAEVTDLARSLVAPASGKQAVTGALATAGLTGSAGRRVGGFSRGMLQRLGLACALVGEPELLILDEPTSALDPAGRAEKGRRHQHRGRRARDPGGDRRLRCPSGFLRAGGRRPGIGVPRPDRRQFLGARWQPRVHREHGAG